VSRIVSPFGLGCCTTDRRQTARPGSPFVRLLVRRPAVYRKDVLVPPTIVLIHGLWLTPRSWEGWKARFEERGHEVLAPAWPRMEGEVEALRRDPSILNGLGIAEVVEHYDRIIRDLDTPPVIMGHSTGGLVTELLLDRGLGAAGACLSPAPVKGVLRLPPALLRTVFPGLRNPANRKKTIALTPKQFRRGFTNTMSDEAAQAAYERYAVAAPGRVVFQAAFANLNPRAVTKVDFHKDDRPPLLVMGNDQDHTIPASVSREAAKRLGKSRAVVDYKEFVGRPHFPAAPGWEAVADYALDWANSHVGAPAKARERARV
jgi:pimeloyl-ACP methyl ester carboxylesterase